MEGSFSMTASTPAQRPIPAPETMKDAGMPNAGADQVHSMNTVTSRVAHILLTTQSFATKYDQEHGREVPHKGPLLHLRDRRVLRHGLLRNMLPVQLLPDLPQSDTRPECRGNVEG